MDEKDAYYVVQKGGVVGVYKILYDLQADFGSMAGSQGISVYKGYGLTKEAEEYLAASHGMKNASYSIGAVDVKDGLFGKVSICPFQSAILQASINLSSSVSNLQRAQLSVQSLISVDFSCTIDFDGASKGNPGLAGAGVILRVDGRSMEYNTEADAQANLAVYLKIQEECNTE